jgi:hypothetical protein
MSPHPFFSLRPSLRRLLISSFACFFGLLQGQLLHAQIIGGDDEEPPPTASVVNYDPALKIVEGVMPYTYVYLLNVTSPTNTPTGVPTTVPLTKSGNPQTNTDGSLRFPLPAPNALDFVTFSTDALVFTGPNQTLPVTVTLSIPAGSLPIGVQTGVFAYIITANFPAALGAYNGGTFINASASVPPPASQPPAIAISTPAAAQVYNVLASAMPVDIPLNFIATGTAAEPILGMDAIVDGGAIIPLTTTGIDTATASATGQMHMTQAGTHQVLVRGFSSSGTGTATTTFTVNVTSVKPVVTIQSPTPNASFTVMAGSPPPTTQFIFKADSEFGVITDISATLELVGVLTQPVVLNRTGLNTLHATGTTAILPITAGGTFILHCTATSDYGTTEETTTFTVNVVYPTPTVAVDLPTDGATVSLPPGASQGSVAYQFTASTSPGFGVSGTLIALDNGPTLTPPTVAGLGSQTAISTGNLFNVTPGPHTLTVTAYSAGIAVFATSNFTVVRTGTPPTITSAASTTFTYGQADSFTVTGTGISAPTFSIAGALPAGVTFNGTAFVGAPSDVGVFPVTITATNGVSPNATQAFTLTVAKAPATIAVTNSTYVYNATARAATVTTAPAGVTHTATYNGSAVLPVNAGTYNVVATVNDAHYFAAQPATGTLTITKAPLTVSGTVASNKIYDGTVAATLAGAGALNGVFAGDTVSLDATAASATFANKNVGTGKVVTVAGLALASSSAGNYSLTQPATTAAIAPAPLAVAGATVAGKTYDRTTSATLTNAGTLTGVVPGDSVTLVASGASAAFATASAGTGKLANISGLSLAGSDAANYALTQPTTTAAIAPAALTVTGATIADKTYNRSTDATLTNAGSLNGIFAGDVVTLVSTNAIATFADWNKGANKPVSIAGLTLGGVDAAN